MFVFRIMKFLQQLVRRSGQYPQPGAFSDHSFKQFYVTECTTS
jgi:hypothetical protein